MRITVIEIDCVAGWKRVAGCYRNEWPNVSGISGRMFPESVAECFRNTQLDQPERKAIPIRFPAMMKSSFGIDPLKCILCKSRMVLTGIVPGKNMTELRQCHERLALNRPIALV